MKRLLLPLLAMSAIAAAPPSANLRLDSGAAGNLLELNDPACGPSRNAADDYFAQPARSDQTRAPLVTNAQRYRIEVLAADIDHPRAIAFLPEGKFLITTRLGGMSLLEAWKASDPRAAVLRPVANVPKVEIPDIPLPDGARVTFGPGGALMIADKDGKLTPAPPATPGIGLARAVHMSDLILDRDFAKNRTLYFGYVTRSDTGTGVVGRLARARLSSDERALQTVKVIHEAADFLPRRIVQARDGTLFIAGGDSVGGPGPNYQSLKSEQGKILRINTDGSIPRDNPFRANPDADPALYAVGFRDVHGMQIDPLTGALWTAENGPKGGDELNLIRAGGNYGYPLVSYGRDNNGAAINGGRTASEGLEQPVYYWSPSIAPSSLAFYDGASLPGWKNSVFVGAMSGLQLVRLQLKDGRVVGEEKLLKDRCRRIRDVRAGPDGLVYVLTDETKGEILRLVPA